MEWVVQVMKEQERGFMNHILQIYVEVREVHMEDLEEPEKNIILIPLVKSFMVLYMEVLINLSFMVLVEETMMGYLEHLEVELFLQRELIYLFFTVLILVQMVIMLKEIKVAQDLEDQYKYLPEI